MTGSPLQVDLPDRRLKRFLICAILLLTAGYTFLDYWAYSKVQHEDPVSWAQLVAGHGPAPAQYRIGVYWTAGYLAHVSHLQLRHLFAVSDFFCTGLALACIFFLLLRMPSFRASPHATQWAQVFLALLLTQMYLGWTFWFQEPETMPSMAVLAASTLLCWGMTREKPPVSRAMLAVSLLLAAMLGATIRVDAVIALAAGMLVACVSRKPVFAGRGWLAATSAASLVAALAIEYAIAHGLFHNAPRSAPLYQLIGNLHSINGTLALVCTLPAWVLTIWLASRRWPALPVWVRGLVVGSRLHFAMFLTFGMSEEVRIFIPFMLTLVPLSATLLYAWLAGAEMLGGEGL